MEGCEGSGYTGIAVMTSDVARQSIFALFVASLCWTLKHRRAQHCRRVESRADDCEAMLLAESSVRDFRMCLIDRIFTNSSDVFVQGQCTVQSDTENFYVGGDGTMKPCSVIDTGPRVKSAWSLPSAKDDGIGLVVVNCKAIKTEH